jgi:hypothetical protein
MLTIWVRVGLPFWSCLFGIIAAVLFAYVIAGTMHNVQMTQGTSFVWAGTACQIIGLFPAAWALNEAGKLAPEGSLVGRAARWCRDFLMLFHPSRKIFADINETLKPVSATATMGIVTADSYGNDIEGRVARLEQQQRQADQRFSNMQQQIGNLENKVENIVQHESLERRQQIEELETLFRRFATRGIEWGAVGLVYVVIGTIFVSFADALAKTF